MKRANSKIREVYLTAVFAVLGTVILLFCAELTVRLRYAYLHRDWAYLTMGIGPVKKEVKEYEWGKAKTWSRWDDCSDRELSFRVNSADGRGGEWQAEKTVGVTRILVGNGNDDTVPMTVLMTGTPPGIACVVAVPGAVALM